MTTELVLVSGGAMASPLNANDSEETILGVLLSASDRYLGPVMEAVGADDFYHPLHRAIFAAVVQLAVVSRPVDVVTVAEQMRVDGSLEKLEANGGRDFLVALQHAAVTFENVAYHAKIVRRKAHRRRWVASCAELAAAGRGDSDDEDFIQRAELALMGLAQTVGVKTGPQDLKDVMKRLIATVQDRSVKKAKVQGIPTGFHGIDRFTSGWQPKTMVVLAARPSHGKTALALNIIEAAAKAGHPCFMASLEMGDLSLAERMVASRAQLDGGLLRTGRLAGSQWVDFSRACSSLSDLDVKIDDTSGLTIQEIRSRVRLWRAQHPKGQPLVVLDYVQLVKPTAQRNKFERNRALEVAEVSGICKELAKEIDGTVIALAQLNRKIEERTDKRPLMSDLKDSGAIEQDADVILFIYRDEVYSKEQCDAAKKGKAEIIIGKQRGGATGTVTLNYDGPQTRFFDTTDEKDYADEERFP